MRYPGLNALLSDPFAPVHGNKFVWKGFTYKVVVQDYGAGGKLAWLDRNLGASRVATSLTDSNAYGDLYQWGRLADGHEKRTSGTTTTLATTDTPGHGDFIITSGDWRNPQNNNLWQGADGINNPAPPGWRLPTEAELDAERASWATQNAAGAFGSDLRFCYGGARLNNNASFFSTNTNAFIMSSTTINLDARRLFFSSSSASIGTRNRGTAYSVRCVRTI